MSKCNAAWYLIYTRPNQEKKVALQLSRRQIEFLLPVSKVKKQWNDRNKELETPLFPSYVFVHVKSMADYFDCMEFDGFCSYVKFGNQLAIVPQRVIDDIILIVNKGENIEVESVLERGEKVTINRGPLSGLCGEVVDYKGKLKVCVRVNLLNRVILTDIERNMITPVQQRREAAALA